MKVTAVLDRIPVYVKSGSVFPVAAISNSSKEAEANNLTVRVYGDGSLPWSMGANQKDRLELQWDGKTKQGVEKGSSLYRVVRWREIG
jgi:alpha-glucosidase (family GH31 glycosyl hydrolase)